MPPLQSRLIPLENGLKHTQTYNETQQFLFKVGDVSSAILGKGGVPYSAWPSVTTDNSVIPK